MPCILISDLHWPNGRPKKFYNSDGSRKDLRQRAPAKASSTRSVKALSTGKSLTPAPDIYPFDPRSMSRGEISQEFDHLAGWLERAEKAPGLFSSEQLKQVSAVRARYETLNWYRFG